MYHAKLFFPKYRYVMVYKKGYQEFANVESAVVTKVKGVAFTNNNVNIPDIYKRIWDTSDLIVPPSENDAFFITTNIIITPNQTRGACSEVYLMPCLKLLYVLLFLKNFGIYLHRTQTCMEHYAVHHTIALEGNLCRSEMEL